MAVQDDRREVEVRDRIGLRGGETRSGVDAYFDFSDEGRRYAVPVELKSTTNRTVSTARDVGRAHIQKWRLRAKYLNERGSTLNNPHIPKRFFSEFRDYEIDVRKVSVELRRVAERRMRSVVLGTPALRRIAAEVL